MLKTLYLLDFFKFDLKTVSYQKTKTYQGVYKNKGQNGTNYGLSIQIKSVKTGADCQDSCRLSRQLQSVKTVADCQDSCSQSVSQSVFLSNSKSVGGS